MAARHKPVGLDHPTVVPENFESESAQAVGASEPADERN